ncbi:MAG: hypothetical protein AVDCRST_MAG18-3827 [uncultured Thermomicrobiales bacterium]|uniref:N-acetyltransferase domain-containing protein n=1 Tax=uncultured Thermomicrobiales bacterium TaxID=1645740 RepID=A0A6J4VSW7_9BACT|nr:MAG: hypothetical protein AVDCRST_MAG18-3827 [uncultured Thermomicrobiales bacterium]
MADTTDTPDTPPTINLRGARVALGPLRRDLLPVYARWLNDFGTAPMLGNATPQTAEGVAAWYERQVAGDEIVFLIYELATWRPLGTATLYDIHHGYRRASFGIWIGEPDARGQGFGTEVTRLILDYAFTVLGLHNVMLTVNAYNVAGIRAYTRAGFREFGRRRECRPHDGTLHDVVYMDCLAPEIG